MTVVGVLVVVLVVVLAIGWANRGHLDPRRSKVVWDCGDESCRFRGVANHRHKVEP